MYCSVYSICDSIFSNLDEILISYEPPQTSHDVPLTSNDLSRSTVTFSFSVLFSLKISLPEMLIAFGNDDHIPGISHKSWISILL